MKVLEWQFVRIWKKKLKKWLKGKPFFLLFSKVFCPDFSIFFSFYVVPLQKVCAKIIKYIPNLTFYTVPNLHFIQKFDFKKKNFFGVIFLNFDAS